MKGFSIGRGSPTTVSTMVEAAVGLVIRMKTGRWKESHLEGQ